MALGVGLMAAGAAQASPEGPSPAVADSPADAAPTADRTDSAVRSSRAVRPSAHPRASLTERRARRNAGPAPDPQAAAKLPTVPRLAAAGRAAVQTPIVALTRPLPQPAAAETVTPSRAAARTAASVVAEAVSGTSVAVAAQAPAMTAPRTAAATGIRSVLSPLLQTGSGTLVDTPVSWAVFAAARRELGRSGVPAPVAATVWTGQAPAAAATPAAKPVTPPAVVANKAPVISGVTLSAANAGTGAVTGTISASDPEGSKLAYKAATSSKGTVSTPSTAGVFTYTPTAAARHAAAKVGATTATTTDTVTVTVTDTQGAAASRAVTVTISPKNTAPVAGKPTVGTPNATTGVVTGTVTATDADKDTLSYTAPGTTGKGSVTVNTGTGAFTYTPNASVRTSVAGTDSFTVTVTDGYGGSTPVAVSVPVAAANVVAPAKISYVFNYGSGSTYWTPEAKSALQASADAVAAYIVVSKPVTLVFDVTAEKSPNSATLASAGSDLAGSKGFFNTVVQNKVLTGVDANGSKADGTIAVNFGNPWAYGDSVTIDQYDFKSTMMHELLHAYGFLAYVDRAGYNTGTIWTIFDKFIATSSGAKVINSSTFKFLTSYNANLTGGGGGLFFVGPNAVKAYGGPVPLYVPSPWEDGSSVSHLDDNSFTGAKMQMMNAMTDTGLGIRTLSAVELGVLKDIGYTVK